MTTVTVRTDSGKTIETILIGKEHIEDEHANDYILNLIDLAIRNGCTIDQKESKADIDSRREAAAEKLLDHIIRAVDPQRILYNEEEKE